MASKQLVPASMQQHRRSDRSMLMMSDDNVMMKQVVATHVPDGREVDVKPLLLIIEDILKRATLNIDNSFSGTQASLEMEDKIHEAAFIDMLDAVSYTIDKISCEVDYKAFGDEDEHTSALSLLNMLASFSWDAKSVISLAVIALKYGDFCLLVQVSPSNQLARLLATLKKLLGIRQHLAQLKPGIDALDNLIRTMLEVATSVVEFRELSSSEVQALSADEADIAIAVYWIIRSVLACVSQITNLTSMGYEAMESTAKTWEFSTLAHKLNNTLEQH